MAAYQVREDDLPRKFSEAEGALAQLRREARVLAKAAKTQGDLRTAASLSLMDANADLAAATFELIATTPSGASRWRCLTRDRPKGTTRTTLGPATLGGMGIRQWFSKQRKQADEDAVKRAEDEMRSGSYEEREDIAGDIEGMAADNRAARRGSMWSGRDVDPRL